MAVTEMEQIEAEIAAIFSVRPVSDRNVLDGLEVGREMMSEVFLFAHYRVLRFTTVWWPTSRWRGTKKRMDLRHCLAGCG